MVSNANSTTSYVYDYLGRPLASQQATGSGSFRFFYAYSGMRLRKVTYPSNRVTSYTYDALGRALTAQNGADTSTAPTYMSGVQYTASGAMKEWTLGPGGTGGMSLTQTTKLDPRGRPTEFKVNNPPSTSLWKLQLEWFENGNLKKQTIDSPGLPAQAVQSYEATAEGGRYDAANRLLGMTETAGSSSCSVGYGYDGYGNMWWTDQTTCAPSSQALRPSGAGNYVETLAGGGQIHRNRRADFVYDNAGNPTTMGDAVMQYDAEGHMVSGGQNGATAFQYDGEGRRVKKTTGTGASQRSTTYVYDAQGQLAAEYGNSATMACTTCYLITDHLGSTRMVVGQDGAVKELHDYAPFGEELAMGVNGRTAPYAAAALPSASVNEGAREFVHRQGTGPGNRARLLRR